MQKLERFRKDFVLRGEEREEENLNEAASHAKVRKSWKIGKDFVSRGGVGKKLNVTGRHAEVRKNLKRFCIERRGKERS